MQHVTRHVTYIFHRKFGEFQQVTHVTLCFLKNILLIVFFLKKSSVTCVTCSNLLELVQFCLLNIMLRVVLRVVTFCYV